MNGFRIQPAGDTAMMVEFDNVISVEVNSRVRALRDSIAQNGIRGVIETVPTYRSLLVVYDPVRIGCKKLYKKLEKLAASCSNAQISGSVVYRIPVLYGGESGPDMRNVCEHTGLSEEEVIRRHTAPDYRIYMLGFLPGFAYLGGLDGSLVTPRLKTPRTSIPCGSVGIANAQTGIYSVNSPGGWQLIGRTPVKPYDSGRERPILYQAGDYIRFYPVSAEEYARIGALVEKGAYVPEQSSLTEEVNV